MDGNPEKSMRHFVKDLQVSEGTIKNVIHQDLGYKSYFPATLMIFGVVVVVVSRSHRSLEPMQMQIPM
ncbi:hypothetical protein ACTXT7_004945 [Hymenolepis weldensis]